MDGTEGVPDVVQSRRSHRGGGATDGDSMDSRLSEWVAAHPVRWGLTAGLLLGGYGVVLFGLGWLPVIGGAAFALANWFVWRHGGPAHRWRAAMLRRFPKTPSSAE
jgi:hypothetical protein